MPSLYGDNLEAVVSGGEQVTADLGEALYLVTQGLSGKAPRINTTNYHWEVYDNNTKTWVDTGVSAVNGPKGADGYTPTIATQEVTGGVAVTISDGRPSGTTSTCFVRDGIDGTDGEDGVSPTVAVSSITGGHRLTITDAEHPSGQTVDVMDGEDYNLTAQDKADIAGSQEVAGVVKDWLDENISGETEVVIDSSLMVQGAAADAEAVGDRFDEFFEYEPAEPSYNLLNMNDPDVQNGYALSKTGAISAETGKSITGFIPITAGQWYCFHYEQSKNVSGTSNGVYIVLYDANKSYIDYWRPAGTESRIRSGTDANGYKYVAFQMGSSASYFRYTVDTADANSFYMLVNAETMPNEYMPYGGESGRKALREDVEIPDSVLPEGISDAVKTALLACFRGVGWTSPEWQTLYNALYAALYGLDPSEPSLLPAEYQEVEWIGSTGTQLLKVGISFSSNAQADYEMEAEIAVPESNASTALLMCTSAEGGYYLANVSSGSAIGVSSSIVFSNLDVTQKHKYVLTWDASNIVATCEGQSITRARTTQQLAVPSFFGDYEKLYRSKCRIYSAKVKQAGSYVRNLIPCYRKSDNVIGMYDIVGNAFYTNSGTGTFTKGANV